jgi:pimeloyl-ACP methyl ester carboxylesterase
MLSSVLQSHPESSGLHNPGHLSNKKGLSMTLRYPLYWRTKKSRSDLSIQLQRKEMVMRPHEQEDWNEGKVFANGICQHYYRTGKDKPLLLLLHGFTENSMCWSRVARGLEQDFDVIMVDARGHGRSSGPETGYSQEILNQDVAALIQELELHQPFVFGYSNGALTAAQVAATFPGLVRAVILEDPPWSESSSRPFPTTGEHEPWPGYTAWLNSWVDWHKALRTQTPEERVASSQRFLPPGALDWPKEELLSHLEAQAQFNLAVLSFVPPVPASTPWRATVERIECPILLLTSDPERSSVSPQEAQKMAATWRKGQLAYFPHASHFLHHETRGEQFEHFLTVVRTFLQSYYR